MQAPHEAHTLPSRLIQPLGLLAALGLVRVVFGALQRLGWLGRPDAVGYALVNKLEWYLFHAIALDAWEAARLALPSVVLVVAAAFRSGPGGARLLRAAAWLHAGLLLATTIAAQVDQEMMRFGGTHMTPTVLSTWVNPAAVAEVGGLLAQDAGGPGLGFGLLAVAAGGFGWSARRLLRSPPGPGTARRLLAGFGGLVLGGWLLVFVIWPGQFRLWRLATPLDLVVQAWGEAQSSDLPLEKAGQATAAWQTAWLRGTALLAAEASPAEIEAARAAWFPLPDRPLHHASPHERCRLRASGRLPDGADLGCDRDGDGDGAALALDCDDADAAVHPGAVDLGGNGVDEDCSGLDAEPWNVLLILLESHRAMDIGHVRPQRAMASASPELDQLAAEGVAWRRGLSNGLPTIASFMAVHTGLLPHPDRYVATGFPHVTMRALPEVLRDRGYWTAFFSAPDPAWDNQSIWLGRWYDHIDYDRSRESDAAMFEHMGRLLAAEVPRQGRPFLAVAMTKTNHFPFPRVDGVETTGGDTPAERIRDTMRYADRSLARMLAALAKEPWFRRTVVVVTGDHGFPLGEHGSLKLYETVHVEATGVPIVLAGDHPELTALRRQLRPEPASHVDLAPTILDLLGIDASGAWMGRSLLRTGEPSTWTFTSRQVALERGPLRVLAPTSWPEGDALLFDRLADFEEQRPVQHPDSARPLADEAAAVARWMAWLYETDALWLR